MDVNLVLFKKNGSRKSFALPTSVTVIGRLSDCDLYAPLTSVSKKHCQLSCDRGVLKVRDLGSRNGTYLNGKRIDEAVIKAGDCLRIGPLTFVFQIDGQPENINMPTGHKSAQKDTLADDSTADDFDSFPELDDLDSLEDLDSL